MRILLIFFFILCFSNYSLSQQCQIDISVELVSVYFNEEYNPDSTCMPKSINFEFTVSNQSSKELLFGSHTIHYYRDQEHFYYQNNDGRLGDFIMINDTDSILLFTREGSVVSIPAGEEIVCWGTIDDMESLNQYNILKASLQKKDLKEKDCRKAIYEYIKKSNLIYIPYIKDYKYAIKNHKTLKNKKHQVVYPKHQIKIKPMKPLKIIFFTDENTYDYYSEY